jgi:hypothetical protein
MDNELVELGFPAWRTCAKAPIFTNCQSSVASAVMTDGSGLDLADCREFSGTPKLSLEEFASDMQ